MRKSQYQIWAIFVLVLAFGCTDEIEGPIINVPVILDEYTISPYEHIKSSDRSLGFEVYSIEKYEGNNCNISLTSSIANEKSIMFTIYGFEESTSCDADVDIAHSSMLIEMLDIGVYDVNISLDGLVNNRGKILVEFDKYTFDFENLKGVNLLHNTLHRLPENSIWGYIAHDKPSLGEASDDFLSFFSDFDGKQFSPGYYGDFVIDNQKNLILENSMVNREYVKTFTFNNVFQLDQVSNIIDSYEFEYGDEIDIRIFSSTGLEL